MNRFPSRNLILIVVITTLAIWLNLPNNQGIQIGSFNQEVKTHLGLDLIGGTQTLLEADLPEGEEVTAEAIETARRIVERRVNGLGVAEAVVQAAGDRRILVELPGIEDPEEAVATIKGTALLEFVDFSPINPAEAVSLVGTRVVTDFDQGAGSPSTSPGGEGEPPDAPGAIVWRTVMTGADLRTAAASTDELGGYIVQFELTPSGAETFATFTANNVGNILAIVLDKEVISAPQIQGAIPNGQGFIQGNFTLEEANNLAVQLRYGALPIPLRVIETRTIGPTLGQDSLDKSLVAGAIGITIVMLFMALYYRLPGLIADLAILIYASITFALFRTIPVTLTLAGIAGLMLSTGSALDANILIFERLKEELRAGKTLRVSLELGWRRAWPSIRDSNFATIITSLILLWFGSSFGATIVQGFALTLLIGVAVSLFTAITVTRTLLNATLAVFEPENLETWFGI